jgi:nuclear pore complex protein Nup155
VPQYYTGSDGRGTVDDISPRLREGCPSYFKESDYKFYLAVERLERAALTSDAEEKENVAREAFSFLSKVPGSADLQTVCKRFEDLRFYEAVVCLPLQKAQALDPAGDAFNDQLDASIREHALAQRKQCYEIIANALRSLASPLASPTLDEASRSQYICQIVHLGVQSTDRAFREYLYKAMIELHLENELLEYGGPDLVPFLQNAGSHSESQVGAVSTGSSPLGHSGTQISSDQAKYFDLLAKYYVSKRQHVLAAHVFLRLAERRAISLGDSPTLERRRDDLSQAVLQAKNASNSDGLVGSAQGVSDSGLLDLLEGKLAVLQFQIKIRDKLEAIASNFESSVAMQDSDQNGQVLDGDSSDDTNLANAANEMAMEVSSELKSVTQLYNEYAVPFELWEICLEMLYFANYSGDADSSIIRETWARLIDQALSQGGIREACAVLKRVGSHIYPGDGVVLPLDVLCLHLERAALERSERIENVRDEDIAKALLAACKGAAEPVLNAYDRLLSNAAVVPSPNLRIRLLRSVLVVLREWAMSVLSDRMGSSPTRSSLILGGSFALENKAALNQGARDKIANAANRYMTEVRRLALPPNKTDGVYAGFKELDESLLSPFSF